MSVRSTDDVRLTDKARDALNGRRALDDYCSSLWDTDAGVIRHQCVRPRRHDGGCRCACGEQR